MTKVLPACVGPEGDVISANFLLLLSTCYYQEKKKTMASAPASAETRAPTSFTSKIKA